MKEMIEKEIEIKKSIQDISHQKSIAVYSKSEQNSYNLKEQLEKLIGSIDFTYKLNEINLVIGIIISAILFIYFIF